MYASDSRPVGSVCKSRDSDTVISRELPDERKTSAPQSPRPQRSKQLDAGPFAADVASFRLHLAAENKALGTIRIYTEAPLWFAAAHLLRETDKTRWEQVDARDVQRWTAWLLGSYSEAYARQQYRSLRQFFLWLAIEDEVPIPPPGSARPQCGRSRCRSSPAKNFPGWRRRAGATRSHSGATRRSCRCSG
jgi:hypothetical protein